MSDTQTITYYFNTRYANAFNSDTKTYTFRLSDIVHNAVSFTLRDFYLDYNITPHNKNTMFYRSYKNNGFSYEDSTTKNIVHSDFSNTNLTHNQENYLIEMNGNIGNDVYFNQKNDDISNALGFQKNVYSTTSGVKAEKYLTKSLVDTWSIDTIVSSIALFQTTNNVYDDTKSFYISIDDFCHSKNTYNIHINSNDVSKYIVDKAYMYETIKATSSPNTETDKYYTLHKDKKRNVRYYDKLYDIKTLKVKLLHENGNPLNIDLYDFNFEIEFQIV